MSERAADAAWPAPPENIRIQKRSGEIVAVDCVFSHWVDGTAVWNVIWSGNQLDFSSGDELLIGKLPSMTALVLTQVQ